MSSKQEAGSGAEAAAASPPAPEVPAVPVPLELVDRTIGSKIWVIMKVRSLFVSHYIHVLFDPRSKPLVGVRMDGQSCVAIQ
jgi:hypothetical protein